MGEPRTCVIYSLCDPDTGEVRYIGKTVDLKSRVREHRFESRNPKSPNFHTRKARWLRALGDRDPRVEILETVSVDSASESERNWIKKFHDAGARLTNHTDGGEGWPVGQGHSDETKAKLRASAKARGIKPPSQRGAIVGEDTRRKLSEAAIRRGAKPPPTGGWNKGQRKRECVRGHQLTDENRYITPAGRYAGCKMCRRENEKAHSERKLA